MHPDKEVAEQYLEQQQRVVWIPTALTVGFLAPAAWWLDEPWMWVGLFIAAIATAGHHLLLVIWKRKMEAMDD